MKIQSGIDFGFIVLGKERFDGMGTIEEENARAWERMRLQVFARRRLERERQRQAIRVLRERRQRRQFEALREKRDEEYRLVMQKEADQRAENTRLEQRRDRIYYTSTYFGV